MVHLDLGTCPASGRRALDHPHLVQHCVADDRRHPHTIVALIERAQPIEHVIASRKTPHLANSDNLMSKWTLRPKPEPDEPQGEGRSVY
jgi:hypothetical protein